MSDGKQIPIIVGVGEIKNKSIKLEDALEPLELMLEAIQTAVEDTSIAEPVLKELQSSVDSIDIVATWTWPYPDLPGLLSEKLAIKPKHTHYTEHGGNQPAKLLDEAARRISLGESRVAIITGGEALASLGACMAAKKMPPPGWTKLNKDYASVFDLLRHERGPGVAHSVGLPIHIYPMYENGFRAHRKQSIRENNRESAELYAEFATVAERNPLAWTYGESALSAEAISTVSKKNRVICFPYPLLMNAFNNVNLAAACILTSTEYARELGIPESKWIYPLGGAGTRDSNDFWRRPNFHASPSISESLDSGLSVSGLTKEQIDLFDFYSCFPIVPKLACHHLNLPFANTPKPITLLGGLTSFGGAGNNYSMHAITEMTRQLRLLRLANNNSHHRKTGLVLANGGVLTYQHVIVLSTEPRLDNSPYPESNLLPEELTPDVLKLSNVSVPDLDEKANGEAVIESYTVEFGRDGAPTRGHIVGRLRDSGHRFIANHGNGTTLMQLASQTKEPIGRTGWVRNEEGTGRNLFIFNSEKIAVL